MEFGGPLGAAVASPAADAAAGGGDLTGDERKRKGTPFFSFFGLRQNKGKHF